jgi:hypothetical protein
MKNIPNLQFTIKTDPAAKKPATAADLLKITLTQTPQGGFDFATMRARNRLADALDKVKAGGDIRLEDADFVTAKQCVGSYRWAACHPDLLKFAALFGL